jgi:hypothetical protein
LRFFFVFLLTHRNKLRKSYTVIAFMLAQVNKKRIRSYADIRAGMVRRGTSLYGWARKHGHRYTTVISAAKGERRGKKSQRIKAAAITFWPRRP